MSDDLEFRIAKLELGPGDVLLLKTNQIIPDEVRRRVAQMVRDAVKDPQQRVLVIEKSVDLAVLTRAEIDARTEDVA